MKKEDFLILAGKIANGLATDEEINIYYAFLNHVQENDSEWQPEMGVPDVIQYKLKEKIELEKGRLASMHKTFPRYYYLVGIAAAILIVCSVFFLFSHDRVRSPQTASLKHPIVPGSNKAILTLANGKQIILDQTANGKVARENNIVISKKGNGQLVFESGKSPVSFDPKDSLRRNTVSTPKGGQYQVNLSDGTKVWLNAGSTLSFPAAFVGRTRKVDLIGEAYFEVAKNARHPFIVSFNQINVKVLGTHFNIKAYGDEHQSNTTLLEGSIALLSKHKQTLMTPGQQGLFNKLTGQIAVTMAADGGEGAIAWKNGDFMFVNEDIYTVMRQIARWYDVEVEYKGNFKDLQFRGVISRFKNINEVLKLLQLTEAVHFKVVGRRVVVMT